MWDKPHKLRSQTDIFTMLFICVDFRYLKIDMNVLKVLNFGNPISTMAMLIKTNFINQPRDLFRLGNGCAAMK